MPRYARIVVVDRPHHVVHRGNRRLALFRSEASYSNYLELLQHYAVERGLEIWAYCLMPNHVHLIATPRRAGALGETIGLAHRRFAQRLNRQSRRTGHLWENRYYSTVLDEHHLWSAVRYVERNPLRARFVARAEDYRWSSARSHASGLVDSALAPNRPFPGAVADWGAWLATEADALELELLRLNTRGGRPTGSEAFVANVARLCGRDLSPPGRGRRTDLEASRRNSRSESGDHSSQMLARGTSVHQTEHAPEACD